MDRREAIKRATLVMGGTLSASAVIGILQGCTAHPVLNWQPEYFSEPEAQLVSRLSDFIIPPTETPGAVQVGVPPFIERMVKDVYTEEDQKRFKEGLNAFNTEARTQFGADFIDLDSDIQHRFVKKIHDEAISTHDKERPFILKMKELTMLGFFTSEPGATKVLQYKAVPGAYHGCLPLSEVGKTWAS